MGVNSLRKVTIVFKSLFSYSFFVACVVLAGLPLAADEKTAEMASMPDDTLGFQNERAKKRWVRMNNRFSPSGEELQCVRLRTLRQSSVLDDMTVLFERNRKEAYLARLNGRCAGLLSEDRFTYRVFGGSQLCRSDIITVLDTFGRAQGSCSIESFEALEQAPKPLENEAVARLPNGKPESQDD